MKNTFLGDVSYPMRRKTPCFSYGECKPIEYNENDEPINL